MIMRNDFKDPTLWSLITANIISLIFALFLDWSLFEMVWVYLTQNIIIGLTNYLRIKKLEKKASLTKTKNNLKISTFFAMHYGLFHVGYIFFLIMLSNFGIKDTAIDNMPSLFFLIASFIAAHIFSFSRNQHQEFKTDPAPLSILLFYPYIRTIPMHLTIIAAFFVDTTTGLMLFMILKTLGDAAMHLIEHKIFRNK